MNHILRLLFEASHLRNSASEILKGEEMSGGHIVSSESTGPGTPQKRDYRVMVANNAFIRPYFIGGRGGIGGHPWVPMILVHVSQLVFC